MSEANQKSKNKAFRRYFKDVITISEANQKMYDKLRNDLLDSLARVERIAIRFDKDLTSSMHSNRVLHTKNELVDVKAHIECMRQILT